MFSSYSVVPVSGIKSAIVTVEFIIGVTTVGDQSSISREYFLHEVKNKIINETDKNNIFSLDIID